MAGATFERHLLIFIDQAPPWDEGELALEGVTVLAVKLQLE